MQPLTQNQWTPEQDNLLKENIQSLDLSIIARKVKRSVTAVAHRAVKLGLMVQEGKTIRFRNNSDDTQ